MANDESYNKPWLSYSQQLDKLISRGLDINDKTKALEYLKRIGYYRLSGYWFSFRERSDVCCPLEKPTHRKKFKKGNTERLVLDSFKPGTSFKQAVELYVFDKKLRLMTMDALERIEIALRVDISHLLGKYDTFAYLKSDYFFTEFTQKLDAKTGVTGHHRWLGKQAELINRSREEFINHNKTKYGLPVAVWVACEVWDFGCLSTLFSGLKQEDQDKIAYKYGVNNGRIFASWLRSLNYLRNVCAHHSRLWNRNIIDQPKLPKVNELSWTEPFHGNNHALARPYLLFCIARHLLDVINPNSTWWQRFEILLQEDFPDLSHIDLNLTGMGIPNEEKPRE